MSLSESGFVAACVASWLCIDKRLPANASHGMLRYDESELHDSRRGEMVARVIRKGKALAVVYNPRAGQRYGAWGRSSDCVATMLAAAWGALNTNKRDVLIKGGELRGHPAELVARLARENDYAGALALAPFANVKKRDIPLPALNDRENVPGSWRADGIRKQAESAADYLVPELAKARRKKEREARIEAEKERARNCRLQKRLFPYERAYYEAQDHLRQLQRGDFSVHMLLANCGVMGDTSGLMFKVTNPGRFPCSGGNAGDQWPAPGEWTREESPQVCYRGWHLCTADGLSQWIRPGVQELWIAEGDADKGMSAQRDKVAYARARLVRLLATGDLKQLGNPKPDVAAIAAAEAAVEKAEGEYRMAREGY